MSFEKYLNTISGNSKKALKIEWLNPDESVLFEFTDMVYDINVDLSVNYQNGSRRTCTITLKNDKGTFPINFNNIWIGQKFKLWMGIYIDEETPYYFPQGVFYVLNPNEVYQPLTKTIKINGVDKWAFLDGTLYGYLQGTYQTSVGVNLCDATKELLHLPRTITSIKINNDNKSEFFDWSDSEEYFQWEYNGGTGFISNNDGEDKTTAQTILTAKFNMVVSFKYDGSSESDDKFYLYFADKCIEDGLAAWKNNATQTFSGALLKGQKIIFKYKKDYAGSSGDDSYRFFDMRVDTAYNVIDPVQPFISPEILTKKTTIDNEEVEIIKCPYTAKIERGKTYADVLLEYATILCAHIYYDENGRLTIEPIIDTADDITDTNKEILWHFTVEEKTLLGLDQTYNFDKIYNDIIVLGNIVNGYQFKARVQNQNVMSDTCVQKIGIKTKPPIEDNQYYSDEQCKELAMYYAKIDTILQKSGNISSTPLYHLDVNKLVSISTPNNNMSKELFLITGYNLSSSNTMSINVTSVNVLKDFSVVEVDINE